MKKKISVFNVERASKDKTVPWKFDLEGDESMDASDGYHTFTELYEHRIVLFIALCKIVSSWKAIDVWRSERHSDGSKYDGWFVLGMGRRKGEQITYHLPMIKWEETNFAQTRKKAFKFDGHTSYDVLQRLKLL